jgi:transposase
MRCSGCGRTTRAVYDRSMRSWRHLDALRTRVLVRCEVRRIDCRSCGVVSEEVPWARPGSRFTRALQDTCAVLARDAPKSLVARLMRIDWATVQTDARARPGRGRGHRPRPAGPAGRIGIDEVAYRKGQRYLLVIVDHDTGRIVWCAPGKTTANLHAFFDALGEGRAALIEAVSCDMTGGWAEAVSDRCPKAAICTDPFHVIGLAAEALDQLRRAEWNRLRATDPAAGARFKGLRFILRRRAEGLSADQRGLIAQLADDNRAVGEGWLLVDQLRGVYRAPDPVAASILLERWIEAAGTCGHRPFPRVARPLSRHFERILNAIALGITNARLEAMNSTVRLISHRSRGFRRVDSLVALIRLVCGRIPVVLPT